VVDATAPEFFAVEQPVTPDWAMDLLARAQKHYTSLYFPSANPTVPRE
jgi:hypothetical protein